MIKKLEQERLNTNRKIVIIDEALILNGNKEKSLQSLKDALIRELDLININLNEQRKLNRKKFNDFYNEEYKNKNRDESLEKLQTMILKGELI